MLIGLVVFCCGTESLSQTKDSFFNVFFQLSTGGRQPYSGFSEVTGLLNDLLRMSLNIM